MRLLFRPIRWTSSSSRNSNCGGIPRLRRASKAHDTALKLKVGDPGNASPARLVGAKLVGRWPSGAPVEREPAHEDPALADDDCANNNFEFHDGSAAIPPPPSCPNDPFACTDNEFPQAHDDAEGTACPSTGHIRKAYRRDDVALTGAGGKILPGPDPCNARRDLNESNTQTHRLLRRGIPFGPVSRSTPDSPVVDQVDRGLPFLAYQTSIQNQFEFVNNCWVNNPNFKEPEGPGDGATPAAQDQGGGHDPIIGQNGQPGQGRIRTFTLTFPDPADNTKTKVVRVSTQEFARKTGKTDWVIPTGGGYFFAPSIGALEAELTQ